MGESLFYAVLLGAALGLLYDLFRLPRFVFNDKFFFDFFFWIISAVSVFCYYLIFNSGSVRMINLLFIFIGFLLYIFTLGYVTKPLEMKLSKWIKKQLNKTKKAVKSFKKVLHSIYNIYYNTVVRIKKAFGKKSKGDDNDKRNEEKK